MSSDIAFRSRHARIGRDGMLSPGMGVRDDGQGPTSVRQAGLTIARAGLEYVQRFALRPGVSLPAWDWFVPRTR